MPLGVARATIIRAKTAGAVVMPSFVTAAGAGSNEILNVTSNVINHDLTFTVPSGLNGAKLVVLTAQNTSNKPVSVTWRQDESGAQTLTKADEFTHSDNAGTSVELWYLDDPTPDSEKTLRSVQSGSTQKVHWAVLVENAASGAPMFEGYQTTSATSVSGGITIPAPGEALILTGYSNSRNGAHAVSPTGTGHTGRFAELTNTGYRGFGFKEAEDAGSHTFGWAIDDSSTSARKVLALVGITPA